MVHTLVMDDGHKVLDELALAVRACAVYLPVRARHLLTSGLEHIAPLVSHYTNEVYLAFQLLEVYHRRNS